MGKFLRLSQGVLRMVDEAGSPTIYDKSLTVVSGTPGSYEIQGPVTAGTAITLPDSQTYNSSELIVNLNGQALEQVFDFNFVGSIPRTQVSLTFDLEVGDRLDFRVYRNY
jgi:hypothetical protein